MPKDVEYKLISREASRVYTYCHKKKIHWLARFSIAFETKTGKIVDNGFFFAGGWWDSGENKPRPGTRFLQQTCESSLLNTSSRIRQNSNYGNSYPKP